MNQVCIFAGCRITYCTCYKTYKQRRLGDFFSPLEKTCGRGFSVFHSKYKDTKPEFYQQKNP